VITALTAQNTVSVTGVLKVPADFVRRFDVLTADLRVMRSRPACWLTPGGGLR
jgi:hydroxymethylpyrimidine/phosphomethylpyrimidine kinase